MAILAVGDFAAIGETILNILYVAMGLGLVIFFHELGHFGVAKWCGVFVERFSIGFGPILLSKKWGDTEYALSAVPFGGYVKMLGQDDLDPSQLSSEEIARDPRSYSNKSVAQRMAIISAGVIMNICTGLLFFAFAFQLGVRMPPSVLGHVQVGMPAWENGLQLGDRITRINEREVTVFGDIIRGVVLTRGPIVVAGVRHDQSTFQDLKITPASPDGTFTRRMIGVGPSSGLVLTNYRDESSPPVISGTPAAQATPPFVANDRIRRVAGVEIKDFADLQDLLAEKRSETLTFEVARNGNDDLVPITVAPSRFRSLGLVMDIDKITAIKKNSPADKADLRVDDKIASIKVGVTDSDVGTEINPLELPDYFAKLHGQAVTVSVIREDDSGKQETIDNILLTPENKPGWIESPVSEGVAISVPAIGIAFQVASTVLKVQDGSPAAKAGIKPGDRLKKIELILPDDKPADRWMPKDNDRTISIELDSKTKNWPFAFWMMQEAPERFVRLTVDDEERPPIKVVPSQDTIPDWYLPTTRGMLLSRLETTIVADSIRESIVMGTVHTRNTMIDIYQTLKGLISRSLSYKELHGPIGIAKIAYDVAGIGIAELMLFLGMISMNLAVLNFLPIPVLDGGHMVFLCWEAITRKRPSERVLVAATYCGMAFVLGLMLLVIYLDIFRHTLN